MHTPDRQQSLFRIDELPDAQPLLARRAAGERSSTDGRRGRRRSRGRSRGGDRGVRRTVVARRELAGRCLFRSSSAVPAASRDVGGAEIRTAAAAKGTAARLQLITIEEAARLLGVGRTTMYRLIKEEQFMVVHIGRCARLVRSDVDDYIERLRCETRDRRAR